MSKTKQKNAEAAYRMSLDRIPEKTIAERLGVYLTEVPALIKAGKALVDG